VPATNCERRTAECICAWRDSELEFFETPVTFYHVRMGRALIPLSILAD
jgi:hypothetical protein